MGANGATTTPYTLNGILQFLSVSTSVTLGGSLTVSSTTASTSTTTGALVVSGGIGSAGAIYASGLMQSNANTFSGSNASITLTTQNTWYSLGLGALSGLIVVRNRSDGGIGLYWCDAGIGAYAELVTLANFEFRIGSGVPEMRCTSANNKLVRIAALACDLS